MYICTVVESKEDQKSYSVGLFCKISIYLYIYIGVSLGIVDGGSGVR